MGIMHTYRPIARLLFALALVGGACSVLPASGQRAPVPQVAIVVHPDVPVDDLSFSQVRKIFLGDQQFWSNRDRVALLVRAPDAIERDVVLKRVYQMTEGQFRQYWISKIFRSEVASGPKIVYSTDMAFDLVAAVPGSITFVLANEVREGAKVLRVDGRLPGERGYPL